MGSLAWMTSNQSTTRRNADDAVAIARDIALELDATLSLELLRSWRRCTIPAGNAARLCSDVRARRSNHCIGHDARHRPRGTSKLRLSVGERRDGGRCGRAACGPSACDHRGHLFRATVRRDHASRHRGCMAVPVWNSRSLRRRDRVCGHCDRGARVSGTQAVRSVCPSAARCAW